MKKAIRPYVIFVSHCFEADDDYMRLFEYLGETTNFFYDNTCQPNVERPSSPEELRNVLTLQIEPAECAVILASHFYKDKALIATQLGLCKQLNKPYFVIEPFGSLLMPEELEAQSGKVVNWYNKKITDTIKFCARGVEVPRFETLDFP